MYALIDLSAPFDITLDLIRIKICQIRNIVKHIRGRLLSPKAACPFHIEIVSDMHALCRRV